MVLRGRHAVVPLGEAASVALIDLDGFRIERFFTFPSGNATGAAFVNDTTFLVANTVDNYVGKVTTSIRRARAVTDTVHVGRRGPPRSIVMSAGKAFVVSVNLDAFFAADRPRRGYGDRSRYDDADSTRSRAAAPTPPLRRWDQTAWCM